MLRKEAYESLVEDPAATVQALIIVVLAALSMGVGWIGQDSIVLRLVLWVVVSVTKWFIWSFMAYTVGSSFLRSSNNDANWKQLARTIGFSYTPGILMGFAFVLGIRRVAFVVTQIWQLIAAIIAVQVTLGYNSELRAAGVVVLSYIPAILLGDLIAKLLNAVFL